jgi:uncharacterized protein
MHINVQDILSEELGYNRSFVISGETPELDAVKLTEAIKGDVVISRLETGLLVEGHIETAIELECHRCLRSFIRPTRVKFTQVYTEEPSDEEMPIEGNEIDLAPLVQQEILVNLPIKILCRPDCPGVEGAAGEYMAEETDNSLKNQARITKGSKRGRT